MIRLIQRKLIIPRGDTGTFSVPVLSSYNSEDKAVFSIIDPRTQRRIYNQLMDITDSVISVRFEHGDTVNLPIGKFLWDIKFYKDPIIDEGKLIGGTEVDSYYAAFTMPECEVRQTGDNMLTADDAPGSTLTPQQINAINAALLALNEAVEKTETNVTHYPTIIDGEWNVWDANLEDYTTTGVEATGNGIASIEKTNTQGLVDTYTVNFTDGTTFLYNITNGSGIGSITKQGTSGLVDTYVIAYTDGESTTFTITNGATPNITIGTVQEGPIAAASITGSAANPVLNLTLPNANANVPTRVSELENDAGYLTSETDPTVPAWAKAAQKPTYTAAEVGAPTIQQMNEAIANVNTMKIHICAQGEYNAETGVPTIQNPDTQTFYLVPGGEGSNLFIEWAYVNSAWERFGSADVEVSTSDYTNLTNKPQINNVTLSGNKSLSDLGAASAVDLAAKYTKPANGIPTSDLSSAVQTSLGKADTALQSAPVSSVNGQTGTVVLDAQDVGALPDSTSIPTKVSDLQNDSGFITGYMETDPTVPSWAKASSKPTYTATEVGALPNNTFIPANISDLINDSNFAVDANYVHTDNNYTTEEKTKLSGIEAGAEANVNADWNAVSGDAQILNKPTNVSAFTNDAGYLTQHQDISSKANIADLASVATSGSYTDLSNKPTIPTKVSDLIDDSGHYTKPVGGIPAADLAETYLTQHQDISGKQDVLTFDNTPTALSNNPVTSSGIKSYVDTAISNINEMSVYICTAQEYNSETGIPIIQNPDTSTFYLVPGGESNNLYIEWVYVNNAWERFGSADIDLSGYALSSDLASVAISGSYNDLSNKPNIPTIPTNVSTFTNDAGYLTSHQDISGKTDKVTNATNGNFAALDANGNLTDSGYKHSDYLTSFTETDPTVPNWAKAESKPTYTASEIGLGNVANERQYSANNPPPSDDTKQNKITASGILKGDGDGGVSAATAGVDYGTYSKPVGGIPASDMSSDVQTSLGKADTALQSAPVTSVNTKTGAVVLTPSDIGAGTYSKPSGGIPDTDLSSSVQTSLGKADTAYQKPSGGIPASDLASGVIPTVDLCYVTPEEYGAVGDGVTDDTTAVQAALDYGRTNKVSVRGYKQYKTSSPLTISGTYCDVFLNVVSYTGNECGLIVKGSYHTIRLEQLYCSNGGAVVYKADTGNISWVNFQANRVFAHGHAVDFQISNDRWILYNTFNIRAIKSDIGNCYNGMGHVGENVFYNSSCTCESGWAIYQCGGRFYNFSLESDVLNGIYATEGSIYIGFRHRELIDKLVRRINQVDPNVQGGTLIKFVGIYKTPVKYVSEDVIPYNAIDVSEMDTLDDILTASPVDISLVTSLTRISVIDAPIRYGDWTTNNGNFVLGKQMFVAGGRKICVPAFETEYTITDADFDMRDTQVLLDNAKPYPTKMIIGVSNCVIHLPTSYCPYGYSEFIVDQTNYTCTIYDANSSVNPIFNGSVLGNGIYRLKAFCDTLDNAVTNYNPSKVMNINDTVNYKWEIEKIDDNSGSSANVGIINISDYGAVGDGITDDSQAIQDAVDAGYDIYFESNKTYYIPTAVTIDHDIYIHGGENTVIRTETNNGTLNNVFVATGTLKKTTTLTTDYTTKGNTANSGNRFTLSDMTGISIGDIMIITATDQYYNYSRAYYYLGATLLIGDIYDGHLYATDAMPWDIENTQNVSVQIYSAPTVKIENLHFVADMNSHGNYRYFIYMSKCKNSEIKNCDFTQFDSGVCLEMCVNTHVDGIQMSKSEEVEITGDGYSLLILSCSNTIVERMMTICSQAGISLSGTIPNINTYVRNCDLASECRRHGVACHENSYNLVVEDCVLAGLNVLGTGEVNRCRFINNQRTSSDGGITFCGSHNPDYAILRVNNCIFESSNGLYIYNSSPQDPIQAYDNIIGLVEITGCKGGQITYQSISSQYTLSNVIKNLQIAKWEDCLEIYHPQSSDIIENLVISDCKFTKTYWINNHQDALLLDGVYNINYTSTIPMQHKISANKTVYADKYTLPENVAITFSSNNSSAQHIICGNNLMPNDPDDLVIGSVSGSAGESLIKTKSTNSGTPTIAQDADGNIVYTQANNTSSYSMYPVGMFYVNADCIINMSAKVKNTGVTSGATFKPYIVVVDCATGKVVARTSGTAIEATAQGANMSFTRGARANSVAMCFVYCNAAVANAETTFEDFVAYTADIYAPSTPENIGTYTAKRRTGNGSIMSMAGVNNIMSSETTFDISFAADLINNPIGLLPSASGVNF